MNTRVTSEGVAATRVTEDLDFGIAREAVLDLLLCVLRYEFVFLAEMDHHRDRDGGRFREMVFRGSWIIGYPAVRIASCGRQEGQEPAEAEAHDTNFAGCAVETARRRNRVRDIRHASIEIIGVI